MKTFLIYCPEIEGDLENARKHLDARGVEFDAVMAIHGQTFGVLPSRTYEKDHPGFGYLTPVSQVGLCLSHYLVWSICQHTPGDVFMICEADAHFPTDWQERMELAIADLPVDWDIFLLGNSNTSDKPKKHVCGDVWDVKYPFTTHCYLVNKKALPVLLANCRDATYNIDLVMIDHAYPKLNVFTCLPALVKQRGTELAV